MHESNSQRSVIPARQASFWAAAAPLLCALHCITAPLLVLFLPWLALSAEVEYALMGVSAVLAVGLVAWGVRSHRQRLVWLPVLAGLLLWGAGHLLWPHSLAERVVDVLGGVFLAGGLVWNARQRNDTLCGDCGCLTREQERECSGEDGCRAHVCRPGARRERQLRPPHRMILATQKNSLRTRAKGVEDGTPNRQHPRGAHPSARSELRPHRGAP